MCAVGQWFVSARSSWKDTLFVVYCLILGSTCIAIACMVPLVSRHWPELSNLITGAPPGLGYQQRLAAIFHGLQVNILTGLLLSLGGAWDEGRNSDCASMAAMTPATAASAACAVAPAAVSNGIGTAGVIDGSVSVGVSIDDDSAADEEDELSDNVSESDAIVTKHPNPPQSPPLLISALGSEIAVELRSGGRCLLLAVAGTLGFTCIQWLPILLLDLAWLQWMPRSVPRGALNTVNGITRTVLSISVTQYVARRME